MQEAREGEGVSSQARAVIPKYRSTVWATSKYEIIIYWSRRLKRSAEVPELLGPGRRDLPGALDNVQVIIASGSRPQGNSAGDPGAEGAAAGQSLLSLAGQPGSRSVPVGHRVGVVLVQFQRCTLPASSTRIPPSPRELKPWLDSYRKVRRRGSAWHAFQRIVRRGRGHQSPAPACRSRHRDTCRRSAASRDPEPLVEAPVRRLPPPPAAGRRGRNSAPRRSRARC